MSPTARLGPDELRAVVSTYRDALRSHQESINRLNVYPVPDGDTGTNMALTLESVLDELTGAGPGMEDTCKAISHGSLMGARGNSGVILSQILRGVAATLSGDGNGAADAPVVAAALEAASEGAYSAVMRPVEGTILTVVRECATAARGAADAGEELVGVLDAALVAGREALERTPEQLPVLKEAGVVDAGGAGFLLLLDSALHVLDERPLPEPQEVSAPDIVRTQEGHGEGDISDLRYEVMYLLEADDAAIPAFRDVWAGIGDSIVVVGGDGMWNCHIHTDDIGAAVEAALDCGRPRRIRVTDLLEQVEEERWVREASSAPEEAQPARECNTAVVAVCTGEGVRRIFHSLGVQSVVAGGQSMNPSTAQLLQAVEACNAEEVVILPNNKNIVPVAEQVDALTERTVRVVPTRGITEGFAALLAYDPDAAAESNRLSMADAAASVVAGEVTRAVRDSTCDVGPIKEGDYLGIGPDGIQAVDPTLDGAVCGLLEALVTDDHEIVTLIEGEGSSAAVTRRVTEWLDEKRPGVEVEIHHGGQPLYPYLVGVE